MNYEMVFNIFLEMLTLIGCLLVIIFWLVFREENTVHPIYGTVATLDNGDSDRTIQKAAGLSS